ncbi:MAG: hypothetical protein GWP91_11825 [Rhodobacterales bacterium]|nr:hypothetical protein [Rhodobacterales bacterium]
MSDHRIIAVFMAPETEFTWQVSVTDSPNRLKEGTWTSGSPPLGAQLALAPTGTSSAEYVLFQSPCLTRAYAIIARTDGQLAWYEDVSLSSSPNSFVDGLSWTEDNTVLAIVNDDIIEHDLGGNELLRLQRFADYDARIHHDIFRRDGLTYVLFQESVEWLGELWELDGFLVFDDQGVQVAEWHLFDYLQPLADPFGVPGRDYSHANSIWVDTDGTLLMSMRHLSAVGGIVADPAASDFGNILWRMTGEPDLLDFGTDFEITSAITPFTTFERQHNVHLLPDGRMIMFDNRRSILENSRVLTMDIDPLTGMADIEGVYELRTHCDFQGGAMLTSGGNILSTCAPTGTAFEFEPGGSQVWSMAAVCTTGMNSYISRFFPIVPPP